MASKPAFGIELRRAGRSVTRIYEGDGEVLYTGPTWRVKLALPNLPMALPMLVAESELRCNSWSYQEHQIEGWDFAAIERAEEAFALKSGARKAEK